MLALGAAWYAVFLLSLTCHEAAHALAALRLGDATAEAGGQVTLNPWPHVRREPLGTVVVPIVSFALGGWMIGWASAPYDPEWARRHPRREALMALAGPAANLALVVLAAVAIWIGVAAGLFTAPESVTFSQVTAAAGPEPAAGAATMAATALSILFSLNLILFAFNLFPVPPLDGSAVIPLLLGERGAERYRHALIAQPVLSLVGLLIAWKLFGPVFGWLFPFALNLLYPGVSYG